MTGMIWRIVIAVICVLFAYAAIPLFLGIIELSMGAQVWALLKLCIAVLAVLYVLFGSWPAGGLKWS